MKMHAVFTTRHDGDMRQQKTPDTIYAQQVHGNDIAVVSSKDVGKVIPHVDGLVSRDPVRLAVHVADCVPILAHDIKKHILGAAHAGWKGTARNIAKNLVRSMQLLGAREKDIRIIIGPHIGACCYRVSETRAKKFSSQAIRFSDHDWYIDLGRENMLQLIDAGITPEHISVSRECTACNNDRYFSYRKDSHDTFGEQMGTIWIETK